MMMMMTAIDVPMQTPWPIEANYFIFTDRSIHPPIRCVLAAGRTKQQLGTGALLLVEVVEAAPQFAELQLSLRVQFIIYSDRHHLSRNYKPR